MHATMAKSVEVNSVPEDIEQYEKVVESRTRGVELMVQIRAEALGNGDGIRMLTREDKRDLLEAWEDLQVRASDGGNSSKIADLEQECDRLTEALRSEEEMHSKTAGRLLAAEELKNKWFEAADSGLALRKKLEASVSNLLSDCNAFRAELKEQRKELSVLRRALNAANGVVGHFTGRK
jgi:chromosome segregation ATPase